MPSSVPERPWSRVGMDIFELKGDNFLIAVDYYSRWTEIRPLKSMSSKAAINSTKSIFACHGIPDVVVSDNGPQFSSIEFKEFAKDYGFTHATSSPRYPQSNGAAERAVQTVKKMLKKADDPYAALLLYRATPLENGFSPSELLMGRKLKTKLPVLPSTLAPKTPNHSSVKEKEEKIKERQRKNFNKRHATKEAQKLKPNDKVFVRDMKKTGHIVRPHHNPRSFIVHTDSGDIRRNNRHLTPIPEQAEVPHNTQQSTTTAAGSSSTQLVTQPPQARPEMDTAQPTTGGKRTKSGRLVKRPNRLDL